jgi:hypothetical protein
VNRVIYLVLLAVIVTVPGFAEERASKRRLWLRRLTLAGSCAASFWDMRSTQSAVAGGAAEANRLFADSSGRSRMGRMFGFKLGTCAGMAIAQETSLFGKRDAANTGWIAANTAMAATFSAISVHNRTITSTPK